MNIALVHDWLNTKVGGAERVLFTLSEMFPEAPIYTLIYNQDKFDKYLPKKKIYTSYLQNFPKFIKNNPRYLLPIIPHAVEKLDFSEYDIVLSDSSGYVKNIITPAHTRHISYCHSPLRYAWDYRDKYFAEQNIGSVRSTFANHFVEKIRKWDYENTSRVDALIANSRTTSDRIKRYYHIDSQIIYPPVPVKKISKYMQKSKSDYYITLSALTPYKKIDLVIEAFNVSGKKLVVVGDGSELQNLKNTSKSNIEFAGYLDEKDKYIALGKAKALIYPNEEDFGISPVEALSVGTPVIAYNKGGLTETIESGLTGLLFDIQTAPGLNRAIDSFEKLNFSQNQLNKSAIQYDTSVFIKKIGDIVNEEQNGKY